MILDFIAGCIGGMAGVFVGYPFDTIKVHLQTRNPISKKHYQSVTTTVSHLIAKIGITGLYRGVSSPLIGLGVMNALLFGVYGNVKDLMSDMHAKTAQAAAGSIGAVVTAFIISPLELAKIRFQVGGKAVGKNPVDCLYRLYKKEGLAKGVYRGLGITILREIPSNIAYFWVFEHITETPLDQPKASTARLLYAGGLAGIASWVVPYPMDVIKSKIQLDGAKGPQRFVGIYDCYQKTLKVHGYRAFYRGMLPTIVRAFPSNAVTFAVVTWMLRIFGEDITE